MLTQFAYENPNCFYELLSRKMVIRDKSHRVLGESLFRL
jgi:hypothetical protein